MKLKGREKPIAFVSRALRKAEQPYAHIEKEALVVVFRLEHLQKYLFGRSFVIYSDHLPLAAISRHDKPILVM